MLGGMVGNDLLLMILGENVKVSGSGYELLTECDGILVCFYLLKQHLAP